MSSQNRPVGSLAADRTCHGFVAAVAHFHAPTAQSLRGMLQRLDVQFTTYEEGSISMLISLRVWLGCQSGCRGRAVAAVVCDDPDEKPKNDQ